MALARVALDALERRARGAAADRADQAGGRRRLRRLSDGAAALAATRRGMPSLIHEQNAVMGRANKALAAASGDRRRLPAARAAALIAAKT